MNTNISFQKINKLAIPALIAGIAEPLLSITDTAIIGHISENATENLAAVGIVGAFISMLIWVFGQIRSAISSIISQYVGANKRDEVTTLPAQAIPMLVLGSFYYRNFISVCKTNFSILQCIRRCFNLLYIRILKYEFLDFHFHFLYLLFLGSLEASKHLLPNDYCNHWSVIKHCFRLYFVYGIEGYIPAMHIKGAAYASVIAQITMAIIGLFLL